MRDINCVGIPMAKNMQNGTLNAVSGLEADGLKNNMGDFDMTRPSFLLDIPESDYHAATERGEFMTSHRLAVFRRCPLEYKMMADGLIESPDSASFALGRAVHVSILQGDGEFSRQFIVSDGPINPRTGNPYGSESKAYREWLGQQPLPVVSSEEVDFINELKESVFRHEKAKELLSAGIAESTIRTTWDGIPVQCRMDWFNPESGDIVDLKTCKDIDKFNFDIREFGYGFQLAFYEHCLSLAGYDKPVTCWIVAIEKKVPYRTAVIQFTQDTISNCNERAMVNETTNASNAAMIAELKTCISTDVWPTRYEHVIYV